MGQGERKSSVFRTAKRDRGGALTERSIRKAENGLPLGFSQLSKERASVCRLWEETTTRIVPSRNNRE